MNKRLDRTVTVLTQQNPRHHQNDQPAESTGQAEEEVGHRDPTPHSQPENTSPGSGPLLCAADASGQCDKRVGAAINDSLRDSHWGVAIKRGGEGPFFSFRLTSPIGKLHTSQIIKIDFSIYAFECGLKCFISISKINYFSVFKIGRPRKLLG